MEMMSPAEFQSLECSSFDSDSSANEKSHQLLLEAVLQDFPNSAKEKENASNRHLLTSSFIQALVLAKGLEADGQVHIYVLHHTWKKKGDNQVYALLNDGHKAVTVSIPDWDKVCSVQK